MPTFQSKSVIGITQVFITQLITQVSHVHTDHQTTFAEHDLTQINKHCHYVMSVFWVPGHLLKANDI